MRQIFEFPFSNSNPPLTWVRGPPTFTNFCDFFKIYFPISPPVTKQTRSNLAIY